MHTKEQGKRDWQAVIGAKYRRLFGKHGFYAECGAGWEGLLDELFGKIDRHLDAIGLKPLGDDEIEGFQITQVKEKYSTVRVYCWGADDTILDWINEAEEASAAICETCGAPGSLRRDGGWLMTRCDQHAPEVK